MRFTLLISALLTRLFWGTAAYAAEFEVLDKLSVDGYTVFRGSADISGSFAVGGSTFVVKGGNVGIGTTAPSARFHVAADSNSALVISNAAGTGNLLKISGNNSLDAASPGIRSDGGSLILNAGAAGNLFLNYGIANAINMGNTALSWNGGAGLFARIYSANSAAAQEGILNVFSNSAQGADRGGSISLSGNYSTVNSVDFAQIAGRKENATDSNTAGYLQLLTRPNGGNLTEAVRITSAGNVGIGTAGPGARLDVYRPSGDYGSGSPMLRLNYAGNTILNTYLQGTGSIILENLYGDKNILLDPSAGNVAIGATATNHKLRVVGRVAIDSANAGDGPGTFQQLSGYKTAGDSGVSTPIFFCDHTASGRLYVIARYDTGALASAVFDFTVAYGNGGVTLQRISVLGGVSNITATYNNPAGYHIDVAVTWTTNRPTIYWAAEGLGASNWSAL